MGAYLYSILVLSWKKLHNYTLRVAAEVTSTLDVSIQDMYTTWPPSPLWRQSWHTWVRPLVLGTVASESPLLLPFAFWDLARDGRDVGRPVTYSQPRPTLRGMLAHSPELTGFLAMPSRYASTKSLCKAARW